MSDTSQGPGWWLASDGKWYPPELWTGPPLNPGPSVPGPRPQRLLEDKRARRSSSTGAAYGGRDPDTGRQPVRAVTEYQSRGTTDWPSYAGVLMRRLRAFRSRRTGNHLRVCCPLADSAVRGTQGGDGLAIAGTSWRFGLIARIVILTAVNASNNASGVAPP